MRRDETDRIDDTKLISTVQDLLRPKDSEAETTSLRGIKSDSGAL